MPVPQVNKETILLQEILIQLPILYLEYHRLMATSSKKPLLRTLPLLNSIPPELAARFEPTYLEYYNKYSAGRLATHQVPIEDYRRDPAKYTTLYGRQLIDKANLKVIDLKCPVDGGEITVRFVEPPAGQNDAPRPAYINFHGGG